MMTSPSMTVLSHAAQRSAAGEGGYIRRASFTVEGIRCANCSRSIEKTLRALHGIVRVNVNVATSRVSVEWETSRIGLKRILQAIADAGFRPLPLAGGVTAKVLREERRAALKRIGLAGLGMMQVMMYVLGVYAARPDSIDPAIASYLRYVGMLITTPVLFYSGWPFLLGAWNNIRQRSLGMDVPVALALILAYAASVYNTLLASGQTYFDSVTMFIFFLSAGRYLEMIVRQRSLSLNEAVSRSLPAEATRIREDGVAVRIPIEQIEPGQVLSVPRGSVVPVDAELVGSTALVDESLVTGEPTRERKAAGAVLLGGSVNVGDAVTVVARDTVGGSALASIVALLERAQAERPAIARAADRVAGLFVVGILVLAAFVAAAWMIVDPSRAFGASLAVLVVTCPCALSLATPTAVTAASTRLARAGLLVTRADALERLASIDTVMLDKTGTLTTGTPSITRVKLLGTLDERSVLAIAAALECRSSHPIAAAFLTAAPDVTAASEIQECDGRGVAGTIDGKRWRLGRFEFVGELAAATCAPQSHDELYLAHEGEWVAAFELGETARADLGTAIRRLRELSVQPIVASGDRIEAVQALARAQGIQQAKARLSPAEKVEWVRELQGSGHAVFAVGDGINDGPVLAAATVSCAMGHGAAIAQAAADFLLLADSLAVVAEGIAVARAMQRVVRQNLRWSLVYNLAAVPLAALDLVPPWLAAIGMSASSLAVVLNARRLASGSLLR